LNGFNCRIWDYWRNRRYENEECERKQRNPIFESSMSHSGNIGKIEGDVCKKRSQNLKQTTAMLAGCLKNDASDGYTNRNSKQGWFHAS